jgi:hypothetical protein
VRPYIQDEAGRTPDPRPFPFRKLDDPSHFASVLRECSGKESVVYKCVVESNKGGFQQWHGGVLRASTPTEVYWQYD